MYLLSRLHFLTLGIVMPVNLPLSKILTVRYLQRWPPVQGHTGLWLLWVPFSNVSNASNPISWPPTLMPGWKAHTNLHVLFSKATFSERKRRVTPLFMMSPRDENRLQDSSLGFGESVLI